MNSYIIKHEENHKVSQWSGGKTSEIFIYPHDSDYALRNFIFRLSSATIEIDQSEFTKLPGFQRYLMPIEGTIQIKHENQDKQELKNFEKDYFDGACQTTAFGQCVDFNLMLRNGWQGELTLISQSTGLSESEIGFYGFYALTDHIEIKVMVDGAVMCDKMLNPKDLFMMQNENASALIEMSVKTADEKAEKNLGIFISVC